ncbi:TM0106 family RecB-like putative nuclease [Arsenicicoccus piscis]|uniref:TM0106 family RecB-like nuclease n=1 Tax=Arsenicicoccus piscis TaxID=673954 RepID=A0ABQ6HTL8_9MICO|nr:bifunctional RecB family nuclease/DEAD/DEAH box helicase [Arsenicicoccus piscis]MCH8626420.1 TM0106 family RecB-like putative nuclease [Arsenicicoccus piscis]GMA21044.1 hypothetical protein GCM10025862_30650 [Arsenicicoccus piscis]
MILLGDDETGGSVVWSASDLAQVSVCEFAAMRGLDVQLGHLEGAPADPDPLLAQLARLGDAHEQAELRRLRAEHGTGRVLTIDRPSPWTTGALTAARDRTLQALRDGVDVVCQGAFFDGELVGFADFLVRDPRWSGDRPVYTVHDTKLAHHVRVTALLQLAAYADQLMAMGVDPGDDVVLVLGDQTRPRFPLAEILPVYRERRGRLRTLVRRRQEAGSPIRWGEPDLVACGRCAECAEQVAATRDVLMVAGVRARHRAVLHEAGVDTIDALAALSERPEGLSTRTYDKIRHQARLQVAATPGRVLHEVVDASMLHALPAPDPGDIFFDFEGDPLWQEAGSSARGLEYLFGLLDTDETFTPLWAHDRAQERQALLDFLDHVEARRRQHPGMHIYHYAPYETSALKRLAGRHGVGEERVDTLVREHVFVDLYSVVKRSVRISQASYSIKKLEPLYMGDQLRGGDVTTAGESIVEYHRFTEAVVADRHDDAAALLTAIADYNRYDCLSTLRLRDWLLGLAAVEPVPAGEALDGGVVGDQVVDGSVMEADVAGGGDSADSEAEIDPVAAHRDRVVRELMERAEVGRDELRTPEQTVAAMAAAGVGYNVREHKPFWWGHFDRLVGEPEDWADRSALVVERAEVVSDWEAASGRALTLTRVLRLQGRVESGSSILRAGDASVHLLYEHPGPAELAPTGPGERAWHSRASVTLVEDVSGDRHGRVALTVHERTTKDRRTYAELPSAVAPGAPPAAVALDDALLAFAERVHASWPELPREAAVDVLARRAPQGATGAAVLPQPDGDDLITAITTAVLGLDRSYLAVQGPPGTGKTYVASHVIKRLVEQGWRVGVVSQGHAAVEHLLDACVRAGVDPAVVGKLKARSESPTWTALAKERDLRDLLDRSADVGCVVGGTAWDFSSTKKFADAELDLLVVDEAGQFSLANTVASARAANRLLLLGDPQQLPQVSQGIHPAPVDQSALSWLADGAHALPAELGYFLPTSWRLHPAICEVVSQLSYDGRLHAHTAVAGSRSLTGVPAGVATVRVEHEGNSGQSPEEAAAVLELVQSHLGLPWRPGADEPTRPLDEADIIVVAPYNAQVDLLRRTLDEADLPRVRVGTVDRYQGQEAAVAIVSMTASRLSETPRGAGFLLNRNRLNVALSRAQWRAIIVRSTTLTDALPASASGLLELGAFLRLSESTSAATLLDPPR